MIDEYWTWRCYGYHSDELSAQSARRIIAVCECCGKYRDIRMNSYHDLCRSCALRGKTHTDESNQKRSETMKAYTRAKSWWINAHRTEYKCRVCGDRLVVGENWYKNNERDCKYICKQCNAIYTREHRHRIGASRPMNENKKCSAFLGVFVAEQVLSHVFKNVERQPYGNHGFDFICDGGYKIDVKSSCRRHHKNRADQWGFTIGKNRIAEYFLLLAFDNRDDLNPEYIWLISTKDINGLTAMTISETTLTKWEQYMLDVNRVVSCCDMMKGEQDI